LAAVAGRPSLDDAAAASDNPTTMMNAKRPTTSTMMPALGSLCVVQTIVGRAPRG